MYRPQDKIRRPKNTGTRQELRQRAETGRGPVEKRGETSFVADSGGQ